MLVIVDACRGHRASRLQCHVLSWALLHPKLRDVLETLVASHTSYAVPIRIDPSAERAIDIAIGLHLLEEDSGRLGLTPRGQASLVEIQSSSILAVERGALERLPRRLTHGDAERILHACSEAL